MSEPYLDLPANPKPGFKWSVKSHLSTEKGEINEDIQCKVGGIVTLKDGGHADKALLIVTQGTVSSSGIKTPMKANYWYEKGKGLVKVEMSVTQPGKKAVVMTMRRSKGAPAHQEKPKAVKANKGAE